MTKTCYMCDAMATSDEHVPPKSFFPKHELYRRNLITVPSCDAHNMWKSKDDEYLRAIVCISPGANDVAKEMFSRKVIRGMERRPHLFDAFYPNVQPVQTPFGETGTFAADRTRFDEAVGRLARALYFRTFGTKLLNDLWVISSDFLDKNLALTPFHQLLALGEKHLPKTWKGDNVKVFSYAVDKSEKNPNKFICRMRFYEACLIYVGSKR